MKAGLRHVPQQLSEQITPMTLNKKRGACLLL
jgi:hypothetical protein